jgi:Ca2+-binding EF-hand superfamily protein
MGNFPTSFSPQPPSLACHLFINEWKFVRQVLDSLRASRCASCSLPQFLAAFSDASRAAAGIYTEASPIVFRALDGPCGTPGGVPLLHLALAFALFSAPCTDAEAAERYAWAAAWFSGGGGGGSKDAFLSATALAEAVKVVAAVLLRLGVGARLPSAAEAAAAAGEVAGAAAALAATSAPGGSGLPPPPAGAVRVAALAAYAATEAGAHALGTRWRLSAAGWARACASRGAGLPPLAGIASPAAARAMAGEVLRAWEEDEIRGGWGVRAFAPAVRVGLRAALEAAGWRPGGGGGGGDGGAAGSGTSAPAAADAASAAALKRARTRALAAAQSRPALLELAASTGLSLRQVSALRAAFIEAAESSTSGVAGTLDRAAFLRVMAAQLPAAPPALRERLFSAFDTDAGGSIQFSEFVAGAAKLASGRTGDKIDLLWDSFRSGGGNVRPEDLTQYVAEGAGELEDSYQRAVGIVQTIIGGAEAAGGGGGAARRSGRATAATGLPPRDVFVEAAAGNAALLGWVSRITSSAPIQVLRGALARFARAAAGAAAAAAAPRALAAAAGEKAAAALPAPADAVPALHLHAPPLTFANLASAWMLRDAALRGGGGGGEGAMAATVMAVAARGGGAPGGGAAAAAALLSAAPSGGGKVEAFTARAVAPSQLPSVLCALFDLSAALPWGGGGEGAGADLPGAVAGVWDALEGAAPRSPAAEGDGAALPATALLAALGLCLAGTALEVATLLFWLAAGVGDGDAARCVSAGKGGGLLRWMLATQSHASAPLAAAQRLLVALDTDGSGALSAGEFKRGLARAPELLEAFTVLLGAGARAIAPAAVNPAKRRAVAAKAAAAAAAAAAPPSAGEAAAEAGAAGGGGGGGGGAEEAGPAAVSGFGAAPGAAPEERAPVQSAAAAPALAAAAPPQPPTPAMPPARAPPPPATPRPPTAEPAPLRWTLGARQVEDNLAFNLKALSRASFDPLHALAGGEEAPLGAQMLLLEEAGLASASARISARRAALAKRGAALSGALGAAARAAGDSEEAAREAARRALGALAGSLRRTAAAVKAGAGAAELKNGPRARSAAPARTRAAPTASPPRGAAASPRALAKAGLLDRRLAGRPATAAAAGAGAAELFDGRATTATYRPSTASR